MFYCFYSMAFNIIAELYNYHTSILEHFIIPKETPCQPVVTPHFPPNPPTPGLGNHQSTFCPYGFAYSGYFT